MDIASGLSDREITSPATTAASNEIELVRETSVWRNWYIRMRTAAIIIQAGLPRPIRSSRYALAIVLAIFAALFVLPIKTYCLLVAIGFIGGFIFAVPALDMSLEDVGAQRRKISSGNIEELLKPIQWDLINANHSKAPPSVHLSITPAIDDALNAFFQRLLKEVVDSWYQNINRSSSREFQSCLLSCINSATMNLIRYIPHSGDMAKICIYGMSNALKLHIREFRDFETLRIPLQAYLQSSRAHQKHFLSEKEEMEHLLKISALLVKRLLPRQESRSIGVNSLMKEIAAAQIFWPLFDKLSDPDFVNECMIKLLRNPADLLLNIPKGWNMLIVKVIKGQNLPVEASSGGLYCVIHIAGRRVKTRKIRNNNAPLWNETFRLYKCPSASEYVLTCFSKVSDSVRQRLKVHVQLLQYSFMGQDTSIGFVKLNPSFSLKSDPQQAWYKLTLAKTARSAVQAELFIEMSSLKGSGNEIMARPDLQRASSPVLTSPGLDELQHREESSDRLESTEYLPKSMAPSMRELDRESTSNTRPISLDTVLANNELFMEFHEFLDACKAPPYLQFLMNADAYRQFTKMAIDIDPLDLESLANYFTPPLSANQLDQFRTIRSDAMDIFKSHFAEGARLWIPLDAAIQNSLQLAFKDPAPDFLLSPCIFQPAYDYVLRELDEVYLPKFRESEPFRIFQGQHHIETFNLATFDDDRMSVYSADSYRTHTSTTITTRGPPAKVEEAVAENNLFSKGNYLMEGIGSSIARPRSSSELFPSLSDNPPDLLARSQSVDADWAMDMSERMTLPRHKAISPLASSELDMKKIATAITIVREQIAVLNETIEQGQLSDHALKAHINRKNNLQKEAESLMALVHYKQTSDGLSGSGDLWLDLRDVSIKISPTRPADSGVFNTLWTLTAGNVVQSNPLFDIEISKNNASDLAFKSSIVTRGFLDFDKLHRTIRRQFPKVAKIHFPSKPIASKGIPLERRLEDYMQLLISDEFIQQSPTLREFLTLDSDLENHPSFVETIIGKKMIGALHSATSGLFASNGSGDRERQHFYETEEKDIIVPTTDTLPPRKRPALLRSFSSYSLQQGSPRSITTPSPTGFPPVAARDISPQPPKVTSDAQLLAETTEGSAVSGLIDEQQIQEPFKLIEEFTDADVEVILDFFFDFVAEAFELRESGQWLRRKILGVFKQVLKQAYGDAINKVLTDKLNDLTSERRILEYLDFLIEVLWPEGTWTRDKPPPPPRTEEQKLATMIEARTLLLQNIPDLIQNMTGRYNAVCGMTRLFNMLQYKELNKHLIYVLVDIIVKVLFAEQK